MTKTVFKNEKQKEFELHVPEVGRFGDGTQPPVYVDKEGKKVPYEKTKWYQFKLKRDYEKNNG